MSRDFNEKILCCEDCPAEKDATGVEPVSKPSLWCSKEYNCEVVENEPPAPEFFWYMKLYKLQKSGYTIDNNALTLDEWMKLGDMTDAIQNAKEKDRLLAMNSQMYQSIVSGLTKRATGPSPRR